MGTKRILIANAIWMGDTEKEICKLPTEFEFAEETSVTEIEEIIKSVSPEHYYDFELFEGIVDADYVVKDYNVESENNLAKVLDTFVRVAVCLPLTIVLFPIYDPLCFSISLFLP